MKKQSQQFLEYSGKKAGFSINYPKEWKPIKGRGDDNLLVVFSKNFEIIPESKDIAKMLQGALNSIVSGSLKIELSNLPSKSNSETGKPWTALELAEKVAKLSNAVGNFTGNAKKMQTSACKIGVLEAARVDAEGVSGKLIMKSRAFIIVRRAKVFVLTCMASSERFGELSPVFDKMISSFKFSK